LPPFASRNIVVRRAEVPQWRSKSRRKLNIPRPSQVVRLKPEADVRRVLIHILIFAAMLVAISALAIWFNLGPVVHSSAA